MGLTKTESYSHHNCVPNKDSIFMNISRDFPKQNRGLKLKNK
jgi:hypothetical protein